MSLPLCWIDFLYLEGAMHPAGRKKMSAVAILTHTLYTTLSISEEKYSHGYNCVITISIANNSFWTGFKASSIVGDSHLELTAPF